MQCVKVDKLIGNEILAVPVLSRSGVILIENDTILKKEYVAKLIELGVENVYIKDDINRDDDADFKLEETMENTQKVVKKILEKHIYKQTQHLKEIGEAAENIINSVISEPEVIENITEIRNVSTDIYTHCINVCSLSTIMALRLKMSPKQVHDIAMGAILHDIGLRYISVPFENIDLNEMSTKDSVEYKKHTVYGYSSIQEEDWLSDTAKDIILTHHEREDGSGFPFQQTSNKIRQEVKLVAVCDEFDSLISGIGNKKTKIYEAIEYIRDSSSRLFDSTVCGKLLQSVAMYPVGIKVLTNENEMGRVIKQNSDAIDRPIIKMILHKDGSPYEEDIEKDLMKILTLFIIDTIE